MNQYIAKYINHPHMKRIQAELGIAPEDFSATHASMYCKMSEDALTDLINAALPSIRYIDYDGFGNEPEFGSGKAWILFRYHSMQSRHDEKGYMNAFAAQKSKAEFILSSQEDVQTFFNAYGIDSTSAIEWAKTFIGQTSNMSKLTRSM